MAAGSFLFIEGPPLAWLDTGMLNPFRPGQGHRARGPGEFKRGRRDEKRANDAKTPSTSGPSGVERYVHDTSGTACCLCGRGNLHPFSLPFPGKKTTDQPEQRN